MAKHPKSPQGLEGADAKPINSKLKELEAQKERLKSALAEAPDDKPLLHPNLAEIYRTQVEILEAALREPDHGREAFEIVRSLNRAGEHCPV